MKRCVVLVCTVLVAIADLPQAVKELQALKAKIGQMRQWLDTLRLNPDGSLKGPLATFNPETFVRLGAISLYLRGVGASAFSLTQDKPFHMIPAPATPKVEKAK